MYVHSLKIQNLRCFETAKVELQHPGRKGKSLPPLPNVNLLLGDNGAGKTTILKGVALIILGPMRNSGFVPDKLVRRGSREASISANLLLEPKDLGAHIGPSRIVPTGCTVRKVGSQEEIEDPTLGSLHSGTWQVLQNDLYDESSPALLLVGYGATRYVVGSSDYQPMSSQLKRRRLRYLRVAGLFEDHLGMRPLQSWLPSLEHSDPIRFREVGDLLNELLPEATRFGAQKESDEYLFKHLGIAVPLGALSDGYRAYIGWISDLLSNISLVAPKGASLRDVRGVVLVDEIDLHLHPEWQREVVPTVARTLPNLQFIFTSHSPIVAGTLSHQNIFVLKMAGKGASTIRQLEEPIHGLNADQILTSSYFGLDTTRAPGAVDELRDLSKKAMAGDSAAAVAFLKKIASGTEEASPALKKAAKSPRKVSPAPKKAMRPPRKPSPSRSKRTRA